MAMHRGLINELTSHLETPDVLNATPVYLVTENTRFVLISPAFCFAATVFVSASGSISLRLLYSDTLPTCRAVEKYFLCLVGFYFAANLLLCFSSDYCI